MRVAVSVSGQTRSYNVQKNLNFFYKGLDSLFGTYDLYGHTWNDCEPPVDVDRYEQFVQTDQNDIWERFVKHNIFDRVPFRPQWMDHPDFVRYFDNETGFMEFCRQRSIGAYAQVWSWAETLSLMAPRVKNYDCVVRWRWDNTVNDAEAKIEQFKETLDHWVNRTGDFDAFVGGADVLTMVPDRPHWMQDAIFVCRPGAALRKQAEPERILARVVNNRLPRRDSSHELWYSYLECSGAIISTGLPHIRGGQIIEDFDKPNKLWQI